MRYICSGAIQGAIHIFSFFRAALQISMSDSMQTKPNQLVSAPAAGGGGANDGDDLFAGLGLGDYVAKKDTGAIATGLMAPKAPTALAGATAAPVSVGGVTQVGISSMLEAVHII